VPRSLSLSIGKPALSFFTASKPPRFPVYAIIPVPATVANEYRPDSDPHLALQVRFQGRQEEPTVAAGDFEGWCLWPIPGLLEVSGPNPSTTFPSLY